MTVDQIDLLNQFKAAFGLSFIRKLKRKTNFMFMYKKKLIYTKGILLDNYLFQLKSFCVLEDETIQ
jgi:hypothetical protein